MKVRYVLGVIQRLVVLSVLLACVSPALSAASSNDPRKPGTIRMAAILEKLAETASPAKNPFLNKERAAELRKETTAQSPAAQRYKLGSELLNAGENREALQIFEVLSKELASQASAAPESVINTELNRALCHLRMAEFNNCLSNHNADSCLMPIQGGGIHVWKDGSRNATQVLTGLLNRYPENLAARWLLNVSAMTLGEYPGSVPARWLIPADAFKSDYPLPRFVDVASQAGLALNSLSGGSVVDDMDGDGLLDVMVTSIGLRDQMHFYHNNGDGTFTDRTREAGLMGLTGGLNMVSADYNNDGFLDVLILRGGWMREGGRFPPSLLKNNGDGTFEDVTEVAGLFSPRPTQTAAWFDFDGDGWLDVFVSHESAKGESAHYCELYHNNHDGTFTDVAEAAGVRRSAYFKGVVAGDFNNDGRPDLFLTAQGRACVLYRNDGPVNAATGAKGGWKFTDVAQEAAVQAPTFSFPAFFFDFDNDGWEDLYVGGYKIEGLDDIVADYLNRPTRGTRAKLYHNRGNGTFEDVTKMMGLDHVLQGMSCNFGDLDNDGWLDFYLGTGNPDLLTLVPNRMFRNAEGRAFQDVTTSGDFGNIQKGHGISFADINDDGNQDVFHELGGAVSSDTYPNALFLNPGTNNKWIKLKLIGREANRPAIGARVKLTVATASGKRVIYRTVGTGGTFGCNPLRLEIGLGEAKAVESVEIRWPGTGKVQNVLIPELDAFYQITEGEQSPKRLQLKPFQFAKEEMHGHHHH